MGACGPSTSIGGWPPWPPSTSTSWSGPGCWTPASSGTAGAAGPAPAGRPSCTCARPARSRSPCRLATTGSWPACWPGPWARTRRAQPGPSCSGRPATWGRGRRRWRPAGVAGQGPAPLGPDRARLRAARRPGVLRLPNCPFGRLAEAHRDLVCSANLAFLRAWPRPLPAPGGGRCSTPPRALLRRPRLGLGSGEPDRLVGVEDDPAMLDPRRLAGDAVHRPVVADQVEGHGADVLGLLGDVVDGH